MYDIIVVGGGHAGCEAALASAKLGNITLLITTNIDNIASMPCNPSIGGSAKGIVVREIDALGGAMGKVADKSILQLKMLNSKKGPAVRSLRSQADKLIYPKEMIKILKSQDKLTIKELTIEDLIVKENKVCGVIDEHGEKYESKAVILTTGTYLKSDILVGSSRTRIGPDNQKPSLHLSDKLNKYGFTIQRLKTGTPPRILKSSIDYSKTREENGDDISYTFSFDNEVFYDDKQQLPCYLIYTTPLTHELVLSNLDKSSMYGGYASGIGPRYCPSIEDKLVRFQDKPRHQLFLEPESLETEDIYIQGFSTSMPHDVQELMIRSIPALENCVINKYAYAIEYDAIDPMQLNYSLETKILENLFTAGQINGTSGYEEAACQGLIAGINASRKINNLAPLILKRNEAYIGVLIDDLISKGTNEPYRLLTSRAEYRLILRHDNADIRLTDIGHNIGLIKEERYNRYNQKYNLVEQLTEYLKATRLNCDEQTNKILELIPSSPLTTSISISELLKRPEINLDNINNLIKINYDNEIKEIVTINIKYEGYVNKLNAEIKKLEQMENKKIPEDFDYNKVHNLASEALEKLNKIRPLTIGQASRISGVNKADIAILMIYLKKDGY